MRTEATPRTLSAQGPASAQGACRAWPQMAGGSAPSAVRSPRLMIAGTGSGVGKTTIACGLMRACARRGLRVQACKSGPDYLDPMFHEQVLGVPSRNLDLFLGDAELVRALVAEGACDADLTIVEGAMGYYDGIAQGCDASAYELACVTETPVVLVVDGRGRALSMAAEVDGFACFRSPSQVVGVILNRVSASYFPLAKAMVERECGLPVYGYLPILEEAVLESRHLGLVAATEIADLRERLDAVAACLERTVDLDALLAEAQAAPDLDAPAAMGASPHMEAGSRDEVKGTVPFASDGEQGTDLAAKGESGGADSKPLGPCESVRVTPFVSRGASCDRDTLGAQGATSNVSRVSPGAPLIAVARDDAFSFYYHDTLLLLERLGARIVPFSPLHDQRLPPRTCGLFLGGGYPELHAAELSANESLRAELRDAIAEGLPTIAECGGFLYLHESLEDADGAMWPMVGTVSGRAQRCDRLVRFGYATLEARRDSLLATRGDHLRAHEFHYWDSSCPGDAFHATKPQSERSWDCVVATPTLHAGFPHLYLPGHPDAARRFVEACARYGLASGRRSE